MPRYRKYVDGRGFYVTGHFPGVGFCTWQVGYEGQQHLAGRGISRDGDHIGIQTLRELIERGWVRTGGGNPSGGGDSTGRDFGRLVVPLETWAAAGGTLRGLTPIIHGPGKDDRRVCFSAAFLDWLASLDPSIPLRQFGDVTAAGFEDLAARELADLMDDPLHRWFALRGSVGVLWRLARLAGVVARQSLGGAPCPEEWTRDPILLHLYGVLEGRASDVKGPTPVLTRLRVPPRICWRVDLQEVVAEFPGQSLPAGATELSWAVNGGPPVCPHVYREGGRWLADDTNSPALRPADEYEVEARFQAAYSGTPGRWTFNPVGAGEPLVLFRPDGSLVPADEAGPLPAGGYLLLAPTGAEATLRGLGGLSLDERVPVGPLGWTGWSGWRVRLAPGARVGSFCTAVDTRVCWALEAEPAGEVAWLASLPVRLGGLPRVFVSPAGRLAGTVIEVEARGTTRHLRAATDIPLSPGIDQDILELTAVPQLAGCYGPIRLTCHPLGNPDDGPLTLGFLRLPALRLEYVPDPVNPFAALAVRVAADFPLGGLVAGSDTELVVEPVGSDTELVVEPVGSVVLRSVRPASAPGVTADLPDGRGTIRVRVPVTRAVLVSAAGEFRGWNALPLPAIDFRTVHPLDRLRIEFHGEPPTEDGKLVFRVPGAGELVAGTQLGRVGRGDVYEVELHRLRDGFGAGTVGEVQVRGPAGWLGVFPTCGVREPEVRPEPPARTGWQALAADLERAVEENPAGAERLIERCLAVGATGSTAAAELLPLVAARAALLVPGAETGRNLARAALVPLADRSDLPEAAVLRLQMDIRERNPEGVDRPWTKARVDQIEKAFGGNPWGDPLLAECYYNFARSIRGPAPGCWQSCAELAGRFASGPGSKTRLALSDAVLLYELARLMLRQPLGSPETMSPEVGTSHRVWVEAIRFLGRYIWTPRPQPGESGLPALAAPPTVLHPDDASLIRAAVAQAEGRPDAGDLLATVAHWDDHQFFAIGLLRARGARLAGNRAAAVAEYERVRDTQPDLLDVILQECYE